MKLREAILAALARPDYRPTDETGLTRFLGLQKKEKKFLIHEVRLLLAKGQLQRFRGDNLIIAKGGDAGENLRGRMMFRAGGSAIFIPDVETVGKGVDAIQISSDDTGVALHGDRVEVQVNAALQRRRDGRGTEQTGRVLRVIERARTEVVGHLQKIRGQFYITPDDPRLIHDIYVPDPALGTVKPTPAPGDKVVVKLGEWKQRGQKLEGVIIERLGKTFEPRAELAGIYRKYNLDTQFPAEVEREVAGIPSTVQPKELTGRHDYRDTPTFTIDPDDAKDFDDALSIEHLDGGDIRIGIHIADVSAYVKPGTALDREAQKRGNSTYLVGTVVPMLPEKLSNGLCSLVEAQDRLCKAVFLTFDKKQRLKETNYGNTVIRSLKRLTYKQAYAFLFTDDIAKIRALPLPPKHQTGSTGRALSDLTDTELTNLQTWIRELWSIAKRLRSDRMTNGSLDLDMPETKVFVDAEGYADRLEKIEHDESHQLIEEFMLAANEAVARVTKQYKLPSIYRVHDEPDAEKLDELRQFLHTFDIDSGDLTKREGIIRLLQTLEKHPQGYTLRTQLLRSLKKAAYRASPDGHYGLAKKDYTHFTSPIRRYSDLVVHRVFDHYLVKHAGQPAIGGARPALTLGQMESIGEHLSLTEVNSAEAERESVKIKLLEFFERELAKDVKTKFDAVITDVRGNGLFVELTESMTFGYISAGSLTDDYYQLNSDGSALVGRKTKRSLELSGHITVVVEKVDRFKRLIDFRLVPETSPAAAAKNAKRPVFSPTKTPARNQPPTDLRRKKGGKPGHKKRR
ncbi:3'-5' exonuclease [Nibricoccus aquaticus]|uniref:Ribonuclease R n=1 Tax=Nibricoccus aquaticus TaxID=2576891 RepID=A0A290Q9S2_9BACT|nr:RNB domain-containing ribonuclease [Nibricoccus aquaticus]ATC65399.1 3'-5' exonuclease [Nibricoccus aquaticus]